MEICKSCKTIIGNIVYRYNGDTICKTCFNKKPSFKKDLTGGFYTSKDKVWEFDYEWMGSKIPIRSKGQFDRFCKEKGLNWRDTPQRFKDKDLTKRYEYKPVPASEHAKVILETIRERNRIRL